MRTIVLDTNVLLADPAALESFPGTRVIVPETVLVELDKLKTSRVDPDLRFRGRVVSRTLFELSEQGKLAEGVDIDGGGELKVVAVDQDGEMPEGLSARNADDRILAVACTLERDGEDVTLVTNDLNMLLKAQNLGLSVERHGDGVEASFGRRYIVRPFQRYKIPLAILSIALAVFAAIVVLTVFSPSRDSRVSSVPAEFREILTAEQQKVLDYLFELERGGNELDTHLQLANTYFSLRNLTGEFKYSRLSIKHFEAYLAVKPNDTTARTDMAASYWLVAETDRAIRETQIVLQREPDHLQANYNLGIFYWRGRKDFAAAYAQFKRVAELAKSGTEHERAIGDNATKNLDAVRTDAEKAGVEMDGSGQTL